MGETTKLKRDDHGPIRLMAVKSGWVMCRRPYAKPFVMTLKEWNALPGDQQDGADVGDA